MKRAIRAKSLRRARITLIDERYMGPEPILTETSTRLEIIQFYNWQNYTRTAEEAKSFVLTYLRSHKKDKQLVRKISKVDANKLRSVGWACRNLSLGGSLPGDIEEQMWLKIRRLGQHQEHLLDVEEPVIVKVLSIHDRIQGKIGNLIADLDDVIDSFVMTKKTEFVAVNWFKAKEIKPTLATKIAEHYKPLYSELYDTWVGKDKELREAYSHWKRPGLKKYLELVKSIVEAAEQASAMVKPTRKPRKKKEKPVTALVSKLAYKDKDDTYNITSINPTTIVGAQQLWTFNTKTRALTVFNTLGASGLAVKGTTIVGFDENTSITKIVRKPEAIIKIVLEEAKVPLRNVMSSITTKEKIASGRLNTNVTLLRVLK